MKLNFTREEWAKIKPDGRWYYQREKMALEDIATLFAEVERLQMENDKLRAAIAKSDTHD
jgi:regulator of replication initiation timing